MSSIRSLASLFVLVAVVAPGTVEFCPEVGVARNQNAQGGFEAYEGYGTGFYCHVGQRARSA